MDPRLVLIMLLYGREVTSLDASYRSTRIAESVTKRSNVTSQNFIGSANSAARRCSSVGWCETFCKDNENNMRLLSLLTVPGNEDPTSNSTNLLCYTRRNPKNILTAQSGITIHAFKPGEIDGENLPTNLLDGWYDHTEQMCYSARYSSYIQYVVFDLGSIRSVSNVLLKVHEIKTYRAANVDIRLGNTPQAGNFDTYQRLGFLNGMPPYGGYEYITDLPAPATGRYLALIKHDKSWTAFEVCHVEIYEE